MFSNEFCNYFGESVVGPEFNSRLVDNNFDLDDIFTMTDFDLHQEKIPQAATATTALPSDFGILDWICVKATNNNINYEDLNFDKYLDIDSKTFELMTESDFMELTDSASFRKTLFQSKESLFQQNNYEIMRSQYNLPSVNQSRTSSESSILSETIPVKRRPGRPKTKTSKIKKNDKHYGKIPEFLRNLLFNKETNPRLIKWEDYNLGTFKFVRGVEVAELWGSRKNNGTMNFEKFSRALRYHYKDKALLSVPHKKLVYQFGPKTTGWRTKNPILDE